MSEAARSDFHFEFEDRVLLVTGAARGLGACIAERAAAGGARLLLGAIRDAQGEAVAKKIGGAGSGAHRRRSVFPARSQRALWRTTAG